MDRGSGVRKVRMNQCIFYTFFNLFNLKTRVLLLYKRIIESVNWTKCLSKKRLIRKASAANTGIVYFI